ncbi:hypothetical protein L3X38_038545 [Prunus dulcis]|uniref:Uncharacterized protein n=1 Tax=Prunus dulcis TaxID=3755 RepID=A0AAD4V725_PRUDU|nr:hypothetical protein L3X38_038545 [Prunus dulcis]
MVMENFHEIKVVNSIIGHPACLAASNDLKREGQIRSSLVVLIYSQWEKLQRSKALLKSHTLTHRQSRDDHEARANSDFHHTSSEVKS